MPRPAAPSLPLLLATQILRRLSSCSASGPAWPSPRVARLGERRATGNLSASSPGTGQDDAVNLLEVRLGDAAVEPLLTGLAAEYEARYGPGDEMSTTNEVEFTRPDGVFLILVEGSATVAGGGIRRWSADTCEVKRMWTAAAHRRLGHASAVLSALEDVARGLGYSYIRVETGPAQPEAISLYRRSGYTDIPKFGRYEVAFAFEKRLDDGH